MNLISTLIFTITFALNTISTKAEETKADELTLRNQLFADVFLLKEGVDRLQISVEVINKRFSNQMEILKSIQSKVVTDRPDSEQEDAVCDRVSGMFNATLKKHNILESRIITKLQEIQDDQTSRLDEIIVKQRLNKNCGSQAATATLLSTTLAEVSEKIDKFEEKFLKFVKLEEMLNAQQNKLDKFMENQLKTLQEISAKNEVQFEKISKELTNVKNLKSDITTHPRARLPMEVILGLTSSNLTTYK